MSTSLPGATFSPISNMKRHLKVRFTRWRCGSSFVPRICTPLVTWPMSDNGGYFGVASAAYSRLLQGFLADLKIEKGLAALTVSAYGSDINQFVDFLEKRHRRLAAA